MSCDAGHRCGSDLMFLWLWHRPAAAALIGPLAWEPPYAVSASLKRGKKKKEPGVVFFFLLLNEFITFIVV